MEPSKNDTERLWVAQGRDLFTPEKEELRYTSILSHGFLSATSSSARRIYRVIAVCLASVLLSGSIYWLTSTYQFLPGSPFNSASTIEIFDIDEPAPDARLLRFSSSHTEYVSPITLEYLLSYRESFGPEGVWATSKPADVDVDAIRNEDQDSLLLGVSDEAVRQLAGREGYRVGYMDITDAPGYGYASSDGGKEDPEAVPYRPVNATAHPEYKQLVDMVSVQELKNIVGNLSVRFRTRYYRSADASAPSGYIKDYLSALPNATTSYFQNTFHQPNVISRLNPPNVTDDAPTILLAGHLDSTSPLALFRAPGADDDASGTAVMMHVMDILARSGWIQTNAKYPIEGHAYGGEEGGLLGSSAVAHSYKSADRKLRGMLNLEMVGWQPETEGSSTITVLIDPNEEMSEYMESVIEEYVPTAVVRSTTCGYGCSDHYSYSALGYPVVCLASYGPNDENLNPNYHSVKDTMDQLNFERMADFAKASLAWVVQVGS